MIPERLPCILDYSMSTINYWDGTKYGEPTIQTWTYVLGKKTENMYSPLKRAPFKSKPPPMRANNPAPPQGNGPKPPEPGPPPPPPARTLLCCSCCANRWNASLPAIICSLQPVQVFDRVEEPNFFFLRSSENGCGSGFLSVFVCVYTPV